MNQYYYYYFNFKNRKIMTKKMIEYKPALMNISSPPCIAKEEGDVLDCYFFASSNVNLNRSAMGKMITNS